MRPAPFLFVAALLLPASASGQTSGEVQGLVIQGSDSKFRLRGFAGGAGVLIRDRVGVDAEFGLLVDNSDERDGFPIIAFGATLRLIARNQARRLIPFAAAGWTATAIGSGLYVGGGIKYWFRPRAAIHLELREALTAGADANCPVNPLSRCHPSRNAWFLRGGVTFAFHR